MDEKPNKARRVIPRPVKIFAVIIGVTVAIALWDWLILQIHIYMQPAQ
jgi:hypothetical protein